jgi:hypothetical protein
MTSRYGFVIRLAFFFAVVVLLRPAACQTPKSRRLETPHNIYIAPFTSRDSISPKLLDSFRDLFEESFERVLARDGAYTVLNRETIEKVLAEAKYETALTSVEQLNSTLKGRLRIANADGFVFGEVTDDKDSGDIIIAAKLQGFDSILYWSESVTMKRSHLNDRSDRKDAIDQLVRSIGGSSEAKPSNSQYSSIGGSSEAKPSNSQYPAVMHLCPDPPDISCATFKWENGQYTNYTNLPGQFSEKRILTVERFTRDSVIMHRVDFGSYPLTAVVAGKISSDGNTLANGTFHLTSFQGKATDITVRVLMTWGTALNSIPGSDDLDRIQGSAHH